MLGYLSQSGPLHPKHGGGGGDGSPSRPSSSSPSKILPPSHSSLAFIVHYAIAIPSIFWVHDSFFSNDPDGAADRYRNHAHYDDDDRESAAAVRRQALISKFLLSYVLLLFSARYMSSSGRVRRHSVMYEFTWLCNSALVAAAASFGGFGADGGGWLLRRRPLVAASFCVAVSVDQILWYVDLAGWVVRGTFPIGVMKYLTWEQTAWIDRFTCTHHLWMIPLILFGVDAHVLLTWDAFVLSGYVVFVHVSLSRWLTPRCIRSGGNANDEEFDDRKDSDGNKKDPAQYRYLNVNLSHELWKDISFSFLQISIDDPPCWTYLFRLLWRWQLLNGLVFVGILRPLCVLIHTLRDR